jgi:type IV secretion system protein VirD4
MRAWGVISLIVLTGMGALSAATQTVAAIFAYQPALGRPLVRTSDSALYPPWSVLVWSARWRNVYPRPFALADFILLAGGELGVVVGAAASNGVLRRLSPHGRDAWAKFADVANAGLFAETGIVLGRFDGELMAYDGPGHLLLIGASRSGKGRGHVVPTLLAWPRSALVLDVKGELADGDARLDFPGTAGFRETLGPVIRFAPTRADSARFNPLFEVRVGANEVRDVQNIVEIVVDPQGDGRHQDFWDRSAKQLLVGLILHVLYSEGPERKTLAVAREKLANLQLTCNDMRTTLHRRCPETGEPQVHPEVLHAAHSFLAGEERLQAGVKATAESFFGLFADPIVAERTSASDFRIGDLVCGERPVTLYLQPPPSDAARLMPLMRLLINQFARALMESQTHVGEREKSHPLLLALDEFPQLGRMPFFETAMGAMAGYGLKAYLVCQSLNHITRAYGRDNVILDNCHVVTAFAAADVETAKRIAEMAGEVWEVRPQESVARPRALLGPRRGSTVFREERRPLLLPGDVRRLANEDELVFVAGTKPIRAKKLAFDREAVFVRRLRRANGNWLPLSSAHDWADVKPLGRLVEDAEGKVRIEGGETLTNSERALAAFRAEGRPRPTSGKKPAARQQELFR